MRSKSKVSREPPASLPKQTSSCWLLIRPKTGASNNDNLRAAYPEALLVVNKCDLRDPVQVGGPFLATSALTNEGVAELMQAIVQRSLVSNCLQAMPYLLRFAKEKRLRRLPERSIKAKRCSQSKNCVELSPANLRQVIERNLHDILLFQRTA